MTITQAQTEAARVAARDMGIWLTPQVIEAILAAAERAAWQPIDGYAIVPIKPTEHMLEELARIGDGPMISGQEVWGYMLAAAMADSIIAPTEQTT